LPLLFSHYTNIHKNYWILRQEPFEKLWIPSQRSRMTTAYFLIPTS